VAESPWVDGLEVSYDYEAVQMLVRYLPAQDAPGPDELQTEFGSGLPLAVRFVPDESLKGFTLEAVVQGGRDLNLVDGGAECTAGFTAFRNGSRGVLTADHCNDAIIYVNSPNVLSRNPATAANGAVDIVFHRTKSEEGHSTNAQFRATSRDGAGDRTVQANANSPINTVACHWGRGTGESDSCATVDQVNTCVSLGSIFGCGADRTNDDVSTRMDSGGPWFLGSTARGTHMGSVIGQHSYFTRQSRVADHLNATILTN